MPRYVSLINWTDQGVRNFRDTTKRADAVKTLMEGLGGRMVDIYWTLGKYDIVVVTEAPDDETATAALLRIAEMGNVRTHTMRAFTQAEVGSIIAKAG